MSDPVVGALLGAGLITQCVVAIVAFVFALHNAGDDLHSNRGVQRLQPLQSCLFGVLWLASLVGLTAVAFVGKAHFPEAHDFLGTYLGGGAVLAVLSGLLLGHAMLNYKSL